MQRETKNDGELILSDFKTYYRIMTIKTVQYGGKMYTEIKGMEQSLDIDSEVTESLDL